MNKKFSKQKPEQAPDEFEQERAAAKKKFTDADRKDFWKDFNKNSNEKSGPSQDRKFGNKPGNRPFKGKENTEEAPKKKTFQDVMNNAYSQRFDKTEKEKTERIVPEFKTVSLENRFETKKEYKKDGRFGDKPEQKKFGQRQDGRDFKGRDFKSRDNSDRPSQDRDFKKRDNNDRPARGGDFKKSNDRPGQGGEFKKREFNDRPSQGGDFKKREFNDKSGSDFKKRENSERPSQDRAFKKREFNDRPAQGGDYKKREFNDRPSRGGDFKRRDSNDSAPKGREIKQGREFKQDRDFKGRDNKVREHKGKEAFMDYFDYEHPSEKAYDAKGSRGVKPEQQDAGREDNMPLNKYIAHCGVCSRRDAVELIKNKKVTVNGKVVEEPGYKVMPEDVVQLEGKAIKVQKNLVYVLLNKPKGFITTTDDPKGRRTVMDIFADNIPERVFPVGRLDRNTTGLLLLTNDGDLAQQLSHPKYENRKIYQVTLDKKVAEKDFDKILAGLELEDGVTKVDQLAYLDKKNEIGIEIHSGKNRIVRRIFEHLGYVVDKLDRVMYAGLTKKNIKRGQWRFLTKQEVINLKHLKR